MSNNEKSDWRIDVNIDNVGIVRLLTKDKLSVKLNQNMAH